MAGWLAGWLVGWLAGWLASCVRACVRMSSTVCGAGGGEGTHGITREPRRIPSDRGAADLRGKYIFVPILKHTETKKVRRERERDRNFFFSNYKLSLLSMILFRSGEKRETIIIRSVRKHRRPVFHDTRNRLSFLSFSLSFLFLFSSFYTHLFSPSTFCPGNASGGGKKVGNARHEMG